MIETKCKIEFTAKMLPISTSSKTCKQFLIISELCKGCNKLTKLIICLKAVLTIVITFQSSSIRKLNQQLVLKMLQSYHLRIVFSCADVLEITQSVSLHQVTSIIKRLNEPASFLNKCSIHSFKNKVFSLKTTLTDNLTAAIPHRLALKNYQAQMVLCTLQEHHQLQSQ